LTINTEPHSIETLEKGDADFDSQDYEMNRTLWIAQVLLAALFLATGFGKVATSTDQMAQMMDLSPTLIRFIGTCELLGAVGLILPAVTRIQPFFIVWAAIGLATVMVLATIFHLSRAEYYNAVGTILILGIAVFVAHGRAGRWQIATRATA